jgi:hypothetical protein
MILLNSFNRIIFLLIHGEYGREKMKKIWIYPFTFLAVFIFLVSSACLFSKKATEEPKVIVVTATPESVKLPTADVVTDQPTEAITESATEPQTNVSGGSEPYFREEFDGNLDNYSYNVIVDGNSEADLSKVYNEDGVLKFEQNGEYLYTYVYYEPYTYTDVRIDLQAENLATSDNSITLFCRYDPERGWYEYNIDNDGEWTLLYYDAVIAKGYVKLYDGGSTAINMGRDTNTYTMICEGTSLSLYINGVFTHTSEDKDLKEGEVGFGVSSYDSYPVLVNINWFEISEP